MKKSKLPLCCVSPNGKSRRYYHEKHMVGQNAQRCEIIVKYAKECGLSWVLTGETLTFTGPTNPRAEACMMAVSSLIAGERFGGLAAIAGMAEAWRLLNDAGMLPGDTAAAVAARSESIERGRNRAAAKHGVPSPDEINDWRNIMAEEAARGGSRTAVWNRVMARTGCRTTRLENHGIFNPVAGKRGPNSR